MLSEQKRKRAPFSHYDRPFSKRIYNLREAITSHACFFLSKASTQQLQMEMGGLWPSYDR
jgi:hypothetical protein